MAKQKKKTKEIEYAVKYLHGTMNMSTKNISLELGVSEAMVDGIINQPVEPKPRNISKSQSLMIRQTAAKKTNNVSIMTEAASQLNDELKNKTTSNQSRKTKNAIYRPHG